MRINFQSQIRISAALVLLVAVTGCSRSSSPDRIILVTLDTLRADHLGCYGYPRATTPFIDSLAREGSRAKNAFAPISITVPSHAALFTSLYPAQMDVLMNNSRLPDECYTIAEYLRDRGYETAAFVSVNVIFRDGANFQQGFDLFDRPDLPEDVLYRPADQVIDSVLKWLDRRETGRKFFLWIHLYDTHGPYDPPKRFLGELIRDSEVDEEEMLSFFREKHHLDIGFFERVPQELYEDSTGVELENFQSLPGDEKLMKMMNAYDGEARFADSELRRLYEVFQNRGLNEDSLWIITADHGEGLGHHDWLEHTREIYNEQLHVPLILHFPSESFRRAEIEEVTELIDIFPTVAALLGDRLDGISPQSQGRSIPGMAAGVKSSAGAVKPAGWAFAQRQRYLEKQRSDAPDFEEGEKYSLQDGGFKYILRTAGPDEFYRLRRDPYEADNLVGRGLPEEEELKNRLLEIVARLTREKGPGPTPVLTEREKDRLRTLGYLN